MPRALTACLLGVCLALAAHPIAAQAAEPAKSWPWFRGVDRSGVSAETGLLQAWPEGGPKLLVEAKGAGRGYASVVIVEGKMYTLGDGLSTAEAGDKDEYLTAFDVADGKQLWKTKTGPAWTSGQESWQSSRSTPAVDGDLIYVISPHGLLFCCQTENGEVAWQKDLKKDFEGNKGDGWGYSESPLVDGDLVVFTPGKEKQTMVALNKLTGEPVWSCSRPGDGGAGHASIVITDIGGTKVYVTTTSSGALGVRASDGKLLWSHDQPRATAVIPTAIVRDDLVFVCAGYGSGGGSLLRQKPGADGGVEIEVVYPLNAELKNKHGGVVLVGDHLYGDSDSRGIPWCADLMTGEIKWRERAGGKGTASIIAADGCLYMLFADGTLVLVKADPEKLQVISQFKVGEEVRPFWSHPSLLGGKLFIRDQDRILIYDVKNQEAAAAGG